MFEHVLLCVMSAILAARAFDDDEPMLAWIWGLSAVAWGANAIIDWCAK